MVDEVEAGDAIGAGIKSQLADSLRRTSIQSRVIQPPYHLISPAFPHEIILRRCHYWHCVSDAAVLRFAMDVVTRHSLSASICVVLEEFTRDFFN